MTSTIARPAKAHPDPASGAMRYAPICDLLDALGLAALLLDPCRRLHYQNARAETLVRSEGDEGAIPRLAEHFAARIGGSPAARRGVERLDMGEVVLGGGSWRARGVALGEDRDDGALLLVLDALPSGKPTDGQSLPALTPRERWVARLLAAGCSDKQIAAALAIRPNTARNHTRNVLRKLGVRRRSQVGALLRDRAPP